MNIQPSTVINQNHNETAEFCRKTSGHAFLTENGKDGQIITDISSFDRREKLLDLKEKLLAVENDRINGKMGCTIDELEIYLNEAIYGDK